MYAYFVKINTYSERPREISKQLLERFGRWTQVLSLQMDKKHVFSVLDSFLFTTNIIEVHPKFASIDQCSPTSFMERTETKNTFPFLLHLSKT